MELALSERGAVDEALRSHVTPAVKIGSVAYQGYTQFVRVLQVTYQQKTHVFGHIAPTVGGVWNGDGAIYGGGGSISSTNESIAHVVFRRDDGAEHSIELPSSLSPLAGGLLRLDYLNNRLLCATNISGRQAPRQMLGPYSFIPDVAFKIRYAVLALTAASLLYGGSFAWAAAAALLPGIYAYRKITRSQRRKRLIPFMQKVMR